MPVSISSTLRLSNWSPKDSESPQGHLHSWKKAFKHSCLVFYFSNYFSFVSSSTQCFLQSFCIIFKFFVWFPKCPTTLLFSVTVCSISWYIFSFTPSKSFYLAFHSSISSLINSTSLSSSLTDFTWPSCTWIFFTFPSNSFLALPFVFLYNCTTVPDNLDKWMLMSSLIDWLSVKANRPHGIVHFSRST